MALKYFKKIPPAFDRVSIRTRYRRLQWRMPIGFSKTFMAMVMVICIGFTPLYAQETGAIDIKESYPLIFEDFHNQVLQTDLIRFFEKNFAELIADIEKSATNEEFPALAKFLKTEFKHYAEVLPLTHSNPGELKKWISYKQKEYQSMILGRKIQNIRQEKLMNQSVGPYESQLKTLLAQLLEVKLAKEEADIRALEKRLENLKQIHQIRMKRKHKILQNRFDELVGNRQLYQW